MEVGNRFMLGFVGKLKMLAFNFMLQTDIYQRVLCKNWLKLLHFKRIPLAVVLRINFKGQKCK